MSNKYLVSIKPSVLDRYGISPEFLASGIVAEGVYGLRGPNSFYDVIIEGKHLRLSSSDIPIVFGQLVPVKIAGNPTNSPLSYIDNQTFYIRKSAADAMLAKMDASSVIVFSNHRPAFTVNSAFIRFIDEPKVKPKPQIAKVVFKSGPREYQYKIPTGLDVSKGDFAVVDTPSNQFEIVMVVGVEDEPANSRATKYIVDVVDTSIYKEAMIKDKKLADMKKEYKKLLRETEKEYKETILLERNPELKALKGRIEKLENGS